jgi:rhodanese-related sulfurtransferase
MDEGRFSVSAESLYQRLGGPAALLVIDVRRAAGFDADDKMIAGAIRRNPQELDAWRRELPTGRPVVVYCAHGQEVSQNAATVLRAAGTDARYLDHGIAGWTEARLPTRSKKQTTTHSWVTRERPKIDRIACPWLIRRFIDPEAQFLYAPTERVFDVARETGATAYDIPGAEPFLRVYEIQDPALDALAVIVRGADTARLELAPQAPGLLALSLGLSANYPDDHAMLEHGMIMYDAFYAWCRSAQGQGHDWNPAAMIAAIGGAR